jgi:CrcB protein
MWKLAIIGLGGGIGSILRYGCSRAIANVPFPGFLWSTFFVNVAGSFAIGIFWGMGIRGNLTENWKLFLMTGICGGFTTFSAFSLESLRLVQENRLPLFFLYAAGSVLICLLATYTGIKISGSIN